MGRGKCAFFTRFAETHQLRTRYMMGFDQTREERVWPLPILQHPSTTRITIREASMSDPSDHINTPADTNSDEANSRRDFLLAGAGIVGAAAAAPLLSAPAQAQVNDNDLTTALSRP